MTGRSGGEGGEVRHPEQSEQTLRYQLSTLVTHPVKETSGLAMSSRSHLGGGQGRARPVRETTNVQIS